MRRHWYAGAGVLLATTLKDVPEPEQMVLPLGWMEMDGPTCTIRAAGLLVAEPHILVTTQS